MIIRITKPIIINVYTFQGVLETVTTGGFLGTIVMLIQGKIAQGLGLFRGKHYPVTVTVGTLGTVPPMREYQGDQEAEDNRMVNALQFIDQDRKDKLTNEERSTLACIWTKDLHKKVTDALEAEPRVWTAMLDACQQADQALGLPQHHMEPVYNDMPGRKAIGCDVRVDVNGAQFLFGEAAYTTCKDGRDLYQFTTDAAIGVFPDGDMYYPVDN